MYKLQSVCKAKVTQGLTDWSIPARHLSNGAKHFAVEDEHNKTGNVERGHGGTDEEVGVVERTERRRETALVRVVHTERYWRRHGH